MIVLSLGTNLGDRFENMRLMEEAVSSLFNGEIRRSPLYETAPVGVAGHSPYLNRIVAGIYRGTPSELLRATQEIELSLGRSGKGKLEPRTADIDILLYNEELCDQPDLIIPHHALFERHFEIAGVIAVVPDQRIPGSTETFGEFKIPPQIASQKIECINE